jgi:hypothetical protein
MESTMFKLQILFLTRPDNMHKAGVPLEDALWLVREKDKFQAAVTNRGMSILNRVTAYLSAQRAYAM